MQRSEVNLGGEGEEPGVRNQQPEWVPTDPSWRSQRNEPWPQFAARVPDVDYVPNDLSAYPAESFDVVYTCSVPIDCPGVRGRPGLKSSDIKRILKSGGRWVNTEPLGQVTTWNKPV